MIECTAVPAPITVMISPGTARLSCQPAAVAAILLLVTKAFPSPGGFRRLAIPYSNAFGHVIFVRPQGFICLLCHDCGSPGTV
eukprot:747354-Hanusia_phi.AAC.1